MTATALHTDPDMRRLLTPRLTSAVADAPTETQAVALVAHRFLADGEPAEVLYGGAAGGGKTDWLLMAALEYADVPGYAAILFRRTYADLALPGALIPRSKEWLTGKADWSEQRHEWTFPNGAKVAFGYLNDPGDEYRYQGAELQFCGFDELTQWPTDGPYTYLFSRLRRPADGPLSRVPLRMYAATNPGGVGHGWVKERFPIDSSRRGAETGFRVFVPARIADNPHLDADSYRSSLRRLSPTIARQLEEGDWDVFEGLAYPEFRDDVHVVEPFPVPAEWDRFEFLDFGVNNPTAWYPCAVDYDGNSVVFDEYYSPGLVSAHAAAIVERRKAWHPRPELDGWAEWATVPTRVRGQDGWGRWAGEDAEPGAQAAPVSGPVAVADPSIWTRTGGETRWGEPASVATEFADHGIHLVRGNNNPKAGRIRVSELLRVEDGREPPWFAPHLNGGAPRLFVVGARCPELVRQLKAAPLLPINSAHRGAGEIVDPSWESPHGHCLVAGTMVETGSGPRPIEAVRPGERVLTRDGWHAVLDAGLTGVREIMRVEFSDGSALVGTGSHPVWVQGRGFRPLASLEYGDKCLALLPSSETRTSKPAESGNASTARSHLASTCIIATATRSTTRSTTSSCWVGGTILAPMAGSRLLRGSRISRRASLASPRLPVGFARLPRGRNGVASLHAAHGRTAFPSSGSALVAAAASSRSRIATRIASARTGAGRHGGGHPGWTTRIASAWSAARRSPSTDTSPRGRAPASVEVVSPPRPVAGSPSAAVYNLTVDVAPEFFANGILVHNSVAALRYGMMSRPSPTVRPEPRPDPTARRRPTAEEFFAAQDRRELEGVR